MQGKTNLMDVMLLLLKAAVLRTPSREIHLHQSEVLKAEDMDLELIRDGGMVKLRLKALIEPGAHSKIVLPNGSEGLGLIR